MNGREVGGARTSGDRPIRHAPGPVTPDTGRWLLLATAVVQACAPPVLPFGGAADDPPVVPADYAFTIWGLILIGCVAAAVYGLPRRRARSAPYRDVHVVLSVVHLLFVAWLVAARSTADWLTLPIFVAMLVLLVTALRRISRQPRHGRDRTGQILLGGTVGLYAGWTSAAVWINTATVLAAAGLTTAGTVGFIWQSIALLGAVATVAVIARATDRPVAYLAAAAWAFVGVIIGAAGSTQPGLALVAACGLAAIAVTATTGRRGARSRLRPHPEHRAGDG